MTCSECKDKRARVADVPYIVHEGSVSRLERVIRRLWVLIIILIFLVAGSNIAWIVYENQYEDVKTEMDVEQESESGDNYAVGGDYYNG